MIEKPSILITSIGRTGTEFFAKLFADILQDCTSLHEPDIFKFTGVENKLEHYSQQTQRAGIWRMLFLKALGKWTLVKLSDSRFIGTLDYRKATQELYNQRLGFISKMPGDVYVESNLGYYGLIDVMPEVFKNHRAIYIVRDGRDWIRSMFNWGEVYGKQGIRKWISHKWPAATDVPGDPFAEKWDSLSRFDQLCWAWTRLNEFALNSISKNPNARLWHFEDIFTGEKRYEYLNNLVAFSTSMPGIGPERLNATDGWLERRIHQSSDGFPAWEKWTAEQKAQFEKTCSPLMEKLGYKV
jgi:hypothetical protein